MLARIARFDPSLLFPIEHSTEQNQRDLLEIKLRDNLVRERVGAIQGVPNCGANEEGGCALVLESLSSIDPQIDLDRGTLTTGVAQQM